MNLRADVESLRRRLNQLAEEFEPGLSRRYALDSSSPEKLSLYRRLRTHAGRLLRWFDDLPTNVDLLPR